MSRDEDQGLEIAPEERARAQSLGRLIDAMLAGQPAPPALEAEERALLETATAIHAAMGRVTLGEERRRAIVEGVFAPPAAGRRAPTAPSAAAPAPRPARRPGRSLPWVAAAIAAAAAALVLVLRPLARLESPAAARPRLRSPSALVGPIPDHAQGDATARIDLIYADRLAHYRAGRLGGRP